jgi:hypothetical protein
LNFIGAGVGPEFLHDIRRVNTEAELFRVCETWLDHRGTMPLRDGGH